MFCRVEVEHQYVYEHSNKLFVVGVAQTHPLFSPSPPLPQNEESGEQTEENNNSTKITKVEWYPDVSDIVVSGKKKHGSFNAKPDTPLCTVTRSDGEVFTMYSCIPGKIIEVNSRLESEPNLLQTDPGGEGFLCVVLVLLPSVPKVLRGLVSADGTIDGADVSASAKNDDKTKDDDAA